MYLVYVPVYGFPSYCILTFVAFIHVSRVISIQNMYHIFFFGDYWF